LSKPNTIEWRYALAVALLVSGAFGAHAADSASDRFRGSGKADPIRITNVTCKPADATGVGVVTLDIAWDYSWRTAWEVGEEQHGGKGKLSLENWDAAWVIVKFRKPGADGWSHATLSPGAADSAAPAGAKVDIGLSDDGKRGLGVFVYRNAAGSGPINWKGVTLRWQHAADGIESVAKVVVPAPRAPGARPNASKAPAVGDPSPDAPGDDALGKMFDAADKAIDAAQAARTSDALEIQVFAVAMVYVPEGAFWIGDGTTNGITAQFTAGNTTEPFRIESEAAIKVGGVSPTNLGNSDGVMGFDDFTASSVQSLPGRFPKGYASFYSMKHELTRGDVAAFLSSLSSSQQTGMKELIELNNNGIRAVNSGGAVIYETDTPHVACVGLMWNGGAAYAAWAGLRPMSELEFEKACRGPLKPVANECAWGTAGVPGSNSGSDGYALQNAGRPDERAAWLGANGPDSTRGNAVWVGTVVNNVKMGGFATNNIGRPLRVGLFETPDSSRVSAGASYWGIMELSGNLWDLTVSVGYPIGRHFVGIHGDGTLTEPAGWDSLALAHKGRGGSGGAARERLRVSDRGHPGPGRFRQGYLWSGFRFVRTAVIGQATSATSEADEETPQNLFNEALRIENVTVTPRDAKTATITFDIAWDASWRNATNHDAAWVFFKARPAGATNWPHVRLIADQVLNPAGYGQSTGDKLEFIVPDGPEGFTGVFIQRAAPGAGPLSAKGVTVVVEWGANTQLPTSNTQHPTPNTLNPEPRTLTPSLHAFGLEMVYVAEGPFCLGTGGSEQDRFYRYTDGSQNTLPYRVADAGAIPTGPQEGRLWALGARPDGTDAAEIPAKYPNGYRAFYCMKFAIKQGQFAGFLMTQTGIKSEDHAHRAGNWPVLRRALSDGASLTWLEGATFGAWAGLRPMTELEYEKACRGPRDPVPEETGPSYWGAQALNAGGLIEMTVSATHPVGRRFAGTHGRGTSAIPPDWPQQNSVGLMGRGSALVIGLTSRRSVWMQEGKISLPNGDFVGWRGVRTAPDGSKNKDSTKAAREGFKLDLDPVSVLRTADVGVFQLSGRFRNGGDQALKVELASALPDACFPEGAALRSFTAAPGAETAFRVLTVLTRRTAQTHRRGQLLPVRIQVPGGDVLAESNLRVELPDPMSVTVPVIGILEGGDVGLIVTNASDRAQALMIELLPPPGIVTAEAKRRVEIAAGAVARAAFPTRRRDATVAEGNYLTPYRVSGAGDAAAQDGAMVVELRGQSRWWVNARQLANADEPEGPGAGADLDGMLKDAGLADDPAILADQSWALAPDVFTGDAPPKGWTKVTHGTSFWLGRLKPMPLVNTLVTAATRVRSTADREAVIRIGYETEGWTWLDDTLLASKDWGSGTGPKPGTVRVLVNGEVAYDTRPLAKERRKTIRLRPGGNTMMVQCQTAVETAASLGNLFVFFYDPKTGEPINDVIMDMEVKP
jgi:formylglycine-generating enzyme required for sulfatase activity